ECPNEAGHADVVPDARRRRGERRAARHRCGGGAAHGAAPGRAWGERRERAGGGGGCHRRAQDRRLEDDHRHREPHVQRHPSAGACPAGAGPRRRGRRAFLQRVRVKKRVACTLYIRKKGPYSCTWAGGAYDISASSISSDREEWATSTKASTKNCAAAWPSRSCTAIPATAMRGPA